MVKEFKEVVFETLYAEPSRNGLTKPRSVRGKGYKMINMGELFAYGRICNPPMDLVPLNENEIKNTQMQEGDLLFARQSLIASGAGKCSIVLKCPEITTFESHLIRVRLNKKISNPLFYYYYFSSPIGTEKTQSLVSQVAAAGIRGSELAKLNVHYIDLEYQDKIAKILSNYDDLIENNNKRIKILEEMAQKIYKEWFVDFKFPNHETTTFKQTELGEIPSDWEIKKVSEISTLSKGKSYKSSELVEENEGLPFLNLKCVERDGGFRRDGLKWFDGKYNDTHVVMPEDIIMAVTDMTQERRLVARPARIPHNWYKEYVMSMDLVKLIANNNIDKSYFYSLLKYSNFSDEVKNHANGANVLHLNPQNIEQFELVVADKPTRDSFGNIVKQIYDEIDILYLKNETLKQTRDLLLPRLISGEIDVENMEII